MRHIFCFTAIFVCFSLLAVPAMAESQTTTTPSTTAAPKAVVPPTPTTTTAPRESKTKQELIESKKRGLGEKLTPEEKAAYDIKLKHQKQDACYEKWATQNQHWADHPKTFQQMQQNEVEKVEFLANCMKQ